MVGVLKALSLALRKPVDVASLIAFRIGFGLLMVAASVRFVAKGFLHDEYDVPRHFFHYWGFEWVRPWPFPGMYVHYALMTLTAMSVALGYRYRASVILFGILFTYAHFIDKTNYLNHYYLVTCVSLVMAFLPLDHERVKHARIASVPSWCLWIVRFQVGCVYFFGGVAKLKSDWICHAQPLTIWLSANSDFPGIGRWFHEKWFAYAFSWAGAAFDLTIVGWLLWSRSRSFAYVALVAFHVVTGRLFQLGMFPWIMSGLAIIFFDPSWPRALLERLRFLSPSRPSPLSETDSKPLPCWGLGLALAYIVVQLLTPLRHWLYPGDVLWTEQGFRFAWNVMLIEKNGALEMSVTDPATHASSLIDLGAYLTPYQVKMASTQPDMILELAHIVAKDYARRGLGRVEVHVDAQVALNGRRSKSFIAPTLDLAAVQESLGPKSWLLPGPLEAPEF